MNNSVGKLVIMTSKLSRLENQAWWSRACSVRSSLPRKELSECMYGQIFTNLKLCAMLDRLANDIQTCVIDRFSKANQILRFSLSAVQGNLEFHFKSSHIIMSLFILNVD